MVNEKPEKKSHNQYLLHPFKKGELVKVHSDQTPSKLVNSKIIEFRRSYVRITRKDPVTGEWSLNYVSSWENFDLLTKAK